MTIILKKRKIKDAILLTEVFLIYIHFEDMEIK